MQLTIGRELRDKIERARDLMRHANVDGGLERVVDRAMDALLEKLQKRRLAKTERAQTKPRASSPTSEHVPAAVRRAVFERDGAQCTYIDERGKRCTSCTLLELDHVLARADGGTNLVENLRARCRGHNRLSAEERFGKEHVERCIELRRRKWDVDGADLVVRGLVHMGFASREAKRAVETVAQRHEHDEAPLPKEQILRQALRLLSD
ncbi:MAG TPA: hypothetical protein VIF62_16015 [Labilithrix sp.]